MAIYWAICSVDIGWGSPIHRQSIHVTKAITISFAALWCIDFIWCIILFIIVQWICFDNYPRSHFSLCVFACVPKNFSVFLYLPISVAPCLCLCPLEFPSLSISTDLCPSLSLPRNIKPLHKYEPSFLRCIYLHTYKRMHTYTYRYVKIWLYKCYINFINDSAMSEIAITFHIRTPGYRSKLTPMWLPLFMSVGHSHSARS